MLLASTAFNYFIANKEGSLVRVIIGSYTLLRKFERYLYCDAGLTLILKKLFKAEPLLSLDIVTI